MRSRSHRRVLVGRVVAAASIVACSSSSSGGGTSASLGSGSATRSAASVDVADAFSLVDTTPDEQAGTLIYSVSLSLTTVAGVCAFRNQYPGASVKSSSSVFLDILSDGSSPGPGTYAFLPADAGDLVPGETGMMGSLNVFDAACVNTETQATDGSITLTSVDDGTYVGTYSLTFPSGTLSGSFSAPACPVGDGAVINSQDECR